MKRVILFPIIVSFLASSSGCSSADDIKKKMLHYVNTEFSFSITFPENWSSYKVFEAKEFIDKDLKVPICYICLPTRSREWQPDSVEAPYAAIFSVYIFTPELWGTYVARFGDNPARDIILGKTEKSVFVLKYSNSVPRDLYQYMKEVEKVTATFNIIRK